VHQLILFKWNAYSHWLSGTAVTDNGGGDINNAMAGNGDGDVNDACVLFFKNKGIVIIFVLCLIMLFI